MDDLYRDYILDHYKRPRNFGRLDDFDLEFEDSNPFCGDAQHVYIRLDDDGRVADVSFEGKGCRNTDCQTFVGNSRRFVHMVGVFVASLIRSNSSRIPPASPCRFPVRRSPPG